MPQSGFSSELTNSRLAYSTMREKVGGMQTSEFEGRWSLRSGFMSFVAHHIGIAL